jgi:hypothetical protein
VWSPLAGSGRMSEAAPSGGSSLCAPMAARAILLASGLALLGAAGCGEDDRKPGTERPDAGTGTTAADACELLTSDEVEARLGRAPAPEKKTGKTLDGFALSQCVWEEGDGRLAVAVVGSGERYRMHEQRDQGEPVEGLGDGALVETGTSLEDRGGTGGRTVFVVDGNRTLVVALDEGRQKEVTVDAVVDVARSAHARLP